MIELLGLGVDYPSRSRVLSEISVSWGPGEIVGIVGLNGSGKSTLLKAMVNLLPYRGVIRLDGTDLQTLSPQQRARKLGYLPQQVAYTQPFTSAEVVHMARYSFSSRWGGGVNAEFIDACLRRVGALHLRDRVVSQLSGGEAQRIRLAQALAQEADWWLLDEPTSALDLHQQVELEALFLDLREEGKSLLLALHDLNLARRLCSQVWFLDQGRLLDQGSPDQVLLAPDFQRVFQVKMDLYYDQAGNSLVSPRKIDSQSNFC